MWKNILASFSAVAFLLITSGCNSTGGIGGLGSTAATPLGTSSTLTGYGVVQAIDLVPRDSTGSSGVDLGTVGGALAGGLLGNQVGSGRGQTAATIAGAAGGALVGRQLEQNMRNGQQVYRITLRMDDGSLQSVTQGSQPAMRIGDRVRVVNGVVSS